MSVRETPQVTVYDIVYVPAFTIQRALIVDYLHNNIALIHPAPARDQWLLVEINNSKLALLVFYFRKTFILSPLIAFLSALVYHYKNILIGKVW